MIKMSLMEVAKIVSCSLPSQNSTFHGISHDTRTLKPGNLYIAIRGERFDGHDFIEEAYKKGAKAALISRKLQSSLPQLLVEDTLNALGKVVRSWRDCFSLPIVGVTGSNGKTTTKNMIASILHAACREDASQILATHGTLNNNIGLPLTLSQLNRNHRYAVIEMGMNHFNEIAYLTRLAKPTVALITNAAESHIEFLKNVAGVARAKGEIFLGLSHTGTAILNRDDTYFEYWRGSIANRTYLTFGLQNSAADVSAQLNGTQFTLQTPRGNINVTLPLLGNHNIMNALAATAATLAMNIDLAFIKKGLENVRAEPGRMRQYHLPNGVRIIDDGYNANPFSLQAAVNALVSLTGTKIIVLGDMKELGPDEKQIHFTAGQNIRKAGIDYLFTFGNLSAATTEGFGKNAQHFTEKEKLLAALQPYIKKDVTILIKGSRSMRMKDIVAKIVPADLLEPVH